MEYEVNEKSEEIDVELLTKIHGKKWIKLSELECDLMRVDSATKKATVRGLDVKDREQIRYLMLRTVMDLKIDIKVISDQLDRADVDRHRYAPKS